MNHPPLTSSARYSLVSTSPARVSSAGPAPRGTPRPQPLT